MITVMTIFFQDFLKTYILRAKKPTNESSTEQQSAETVENVGNVETFNNPALLSKFFVNLHDTASRYGTKIIVAYHPSISLNKDGSLSINDNLETRKQFSALCEQNGIYFLDMSERFLAEYEKDFTLPYGFSNTSVGTGHMNKAGHRMFAEEIYNLMKRIEARS